jgi:hypothetical protein
MMVPDMLRDLIRNIASADGAIRKILDPFVGSGTALTEAMFQGYEFLGTDVNPMAILLCRMKTGPFKEEVLESKIEDLMHHIEHDRVVGSDSSFPNIRKWFSSSVIRELSCIQRGIRAEVSLWCRRFFWVALAETVRQCSNARTSTYKLHIRTARDIQARKTISPILVFENILMRNLMMFSEHRQMLAANDLLLRGRYKKRTEVRLRDARKLQLRNGSFDLLVTSPPYGDNKTTVPYGQHSYLPLQWIDFCDIDQNASSDVLNTTHAIDRQSLGGAGGSVELEPVLDASPTLRKTLTKLKDLPPDRARRIGAFSTDLHECIKPILAMLRANAYMIWVIGDRRVGGLEIPTCQILREFLESHGAIHVLNIRRSIPTKRMALKNSISPTMNREQILIFRK